MKPVILMASVLSAALVSGADAPGWNVRDHVPLNRFVIQSHRGAGVLAPENTLAAFELGWELGPCAEADLRTTKDGVIVAFHDENFARVVKGVSEELKPKGVKDLRFAELSKLDVGAWQGEKFEGRHVSRMTEVFAVMRGRPERRLYLDIKNVDLKQLAAAVKEFKVEKQIILASPKHETLREWKSLVPESDTLLWMGGDEAKLRKQLGLLRQASFEGITQLQFHIRLPKAPGGTEPSTIPRSFVRETGAELRAKSILFQALPYDTTEPKVFTTLLDLGVASFSTDYPDALLKVLKQYYAQPH